MEFKDILKLNRIKHGLTQDALGNVIHVSRSAIAKWENGLGIPNEDSIDALCDYFNISRKELFPNEEIQEIMVSKNVKLKHTIYKNRIITISLSLVCLVLSICLIIPFCNRKTHITNSSSSNIVLRQYENDSTLVAIHEEESIIDNKYGYIYNHMEISKIKFTSKSDLYCIALATTFVPGSIAYSSGSKDYNKNADLSQSIVSMRLATNNPSLNYKFSSPQQSDIIAFISSDFSIDYVVKNGTTLDYITLYECADCVKVESLKAHYGVNDEKYISSHSFELKESVATWNDISNKDYGYVANTINSFYYFEKNNISTIFYDDVSFSVKYEMKIQNKTFSNYCNYNESY